MMRFTTLAAVFTTWVLIGTSPAAAEAPPLTLARVSEHLAVYQGPINVGVLLNGPDALLIDCGDGEVSEALSSLGVSRISEVLFTHHHRDQACGAYRFQAKGARIAVPAAERDWFDHVEKYWNDPKQRWHNYAMRPHELMLTEPVRVDRAFEAGDTLTFGPARIEVIATPGHTDGSISYLVEVDGRRIIFCGDAIYDEGQIWDLYSLQKGFRRGDWQLYDYHGFMGARETLAESLGRIKAARPDMLVPSHGRIMKDPARAIAALLDRLDTCYDRYVAISALRHYFPQLFTKYANRPDHMPIRPGKAPPAFLRHIHTTWVIVSEDKAAWVMDCHNDGVIRAVQEMIDRGDIRTVEGLWVTHYHDDHVDSIPAFVKRFGCPCVTDRSVADVISRPAAWHLPCMSPSVIRVDRPTSDGESWPWHEFRMTAYHLPGQTLYHSGLFVEGRGVRMFFVGDSFTPAGIDDYCMYNRNSLGKDVGFDHCIALIEKLQPTHIFNCHVDKAFDFTPEQCRFMRANLAEREKLFGQIVPWDHANYGTDAHWVRCDPYEQTARPGARIEIGVVITNHSTQPRVAECRAVLPRSWLAGAPSTLPAAAGAQAAEWSRAEVPAKKEGTVRLVVTIPAGAKAGRYPVPIDVRFGPWVLPQYTADIVEIP
jgi:glyoxylase-like metal-dependent hydrolase (beta-lactamase superfamily II)